MKNSYQHVQASLLRFLNTKAQAAGVKALNLDAYADIESLPEGDCFGLTGLSMQQDDELEQLTAMLVVVTESDPNNMRLSERVSQLYDACKAEEQVELVSAETGEKLGRMVMVNGTNVFPVTRHTQTKAAQSVGFVAMLLPAGFDLPQE